MYKKIMVPVDLAHQDKLEKATRIASDLAKLYEAEVHYVAVSTSAPSELGRNSEAFSQKLEEFVSGQIETYGLKGQAHPIISADPTADMDLMLRNAGEYIGADLIVMASHVPGFRENLFHHHGNYIATHAHMSVLLVR